MKAKHKKEILKVFIILENTQIIINRMNISGDSRGSYMEMRNRLFNTGGKAILVIKWQRTCSPIGWDTELANDKLGYLAQEIIKQNVITIVLFLLAACKEM